MPPLEVADIFRRHAKEYIESHGPTSARQRRIIKAIELCRTAALGGHVAKCDRCEHKEVYYNSCRNGHCPKCQGVARGRWLKARQGELLPVKYFHIVFTIPEEFRLIAYQNKQTVYGILFRAAAETLLQLARDPRHLGAEIGFFGILHTWGQTLCHHPHVHFVVPAGGLSPDRTKWISASEKFFLPLKVVRIVFRGKFIDLLKRAFAEGQLTFHGGVAKLADAEAFEANLDKASRHEWVIYLKRPFADPDRVLKYLARYVHRVAISNHRLVSMDGNTVTFKWKDYADNDKIKLMTLDVFEFIRRFLLHAVPLGFHRIRYYGFLSPRKRGGSLELCRQLLPQPVELPLHADDDREPLEPRDFEDKPERCPKCKEGTMMIIQTICPIPFWRIQESTPALVDTS